MTTVAKLVADLVVNTFSFDKGLKRAGQSADSFQTQIKKSFKNVGTAFDDAAKSVFSLNGALTSALSVGGFALLGQQALSAAEQVKTMADRLGLSTTEFQRFQYGAGLANVKAEEFEAGIKRLNVAIAEGKLKYKDTGSAILDIADRMRNAKDGIERAKIANDAFSKGGAALIPFLQLGSDGIRKLGDEAERLGIVLDSGTIDSADRFKDELETLGKVVSSNFQQGFLSGFVEESQTIRDIYTDPQFAESIKDVGEAFGAIASSVIAVAQAYRDAKFAVAEFMIRVTSADNPEAFNAQLKLLEEYKNKLNEIAKPVEITASGGASGSQVADNKEIENRQKVIEQINRQIEQEAVLADVKISNAGQSEAIINRAIRAKQIELQLAAQGIQLTAQEREAIKSKLDILEQNTAVLEQLDKQQKEQEEAVRRQKQFTDQLGASFESAFENAIVNGDKFSDVLNGLLQDIIRLTLRTQLIQPLVSSIGGAGGIGGLFSSFLPSFAVGTNYVPNDMIANIHKGEMIIPAAEAAAMRSGGVGGGVKVNVINNTPSKVQTSATESSSGTELNIMIDQAVADNITRKGTKTNQALGDFANRGMIRR
jgi:hypothetical protein